MTIVKRLRDLVAWGSITLGALSLSGCIDASKPILTDSQAVFGPHLRLQFFSLHKGIAQDPEQATFAWNGAHYTRTGGGMRYVSTFSVHSFEAGDDILQVVSAEGARLT